MKRPEYAYIYIYMGLWWPPAGPREVSSLITDPPGTPVIPCDKMLNVSSPRSFKSVQTFHTHTHTHTRAHTHTYIYIYICRYRQKERERERVSEWVSECSFQHVMIMQVFVCRSGHSRHIQSQMQVLKPRIYLQLDLWCSVQIFTNIYQHLLTCANKYSRVQLEAGEQPPDSPWMFGGLDGPGSVFKPKTPKN